MPKAFWAHVRAIGEAAGYTDRKTGQIQTLSPAAIVNACAKAGLSSQHLVANGQPTSDGRQLIDYFAYRAEVLNGYVEPRLMDKAEAAALYSQLRKEHPVNAAAPLNKQKGDKAGTALLTAMVNLIIEAHRDGYSVEYDPRRLTAITSNGVALRTLSRRVDGAFPAAVNPLAIWEIKEYYNTTTFGSRVADGVYETLLDGMELEELREHEQVHVEHLLIIDAKYTWWKCGRSYLCRIIDMLHIGYVDEVLFGREVAERLPGIVRSWVAEARAKGLAPVGSLL